MKIPSQKTARRYLLFASAALFLVFAGCDGRINCYLEEEKIGEITENDPAIVSASRPEKVHYFFDKTESMGGFTAKGDESVYVNAIDSIWKAGKNVFQDSNHVYYEYGEWSSMNIISELDAQDVKLPSFYRPGRPSKGRFVYTGKGQPFGDVSDWIKTNLSPNDLYVINTDLYEQYQGENFFVSFYRNAFENGMSGAFFAIESDFTGKVYGYSPTNPDAFIDVPKNGKSIFFILVIGGRDIATAYSGRLAKEIADKGLSVKYWLFTNGFGSNPSLAMPISYKVAQNERRFGEYEMETVNLRILKQPGETGLYQWTKTENGYKSVPAQVQAYRMQTDIGSRLVAGIPAPAIHTDFDFDVKLTVEHSNGISRKTEPGNPTQFRPMEQSGFNASAGLFLDGELPFGLKIESRNKRLGSGVYRAAYTIYQKATVPEWIVERSVTNPTELIAALKDGKPKVLSLKKVFEDIADTYNKVAERKVSSGTIYFVKLK